MKTYLLPAIKMTIVCLFLCVGMYTLLIWGIGQLLGPNNGQAELMESDGKVVGAANLGQLFSSDGYFHGRPSAVDYNAAGSGGSNKAPSNPDYLDLLRERLDAYSSLNGTMAGTPVTSDAITASGSGLDPHLSKYAALLQAPRISRARNIDERLVRDLVEAHTQEALWRLFGPKDYVNVLKLNIALDDL